MNTKLSVVLLTMSGLIGALQTYAADPDGTSGAWDLTVQSASGPTPSWVKLFHENDVPIVEFVGSTGGKHRADAVKVDGDTFEWTIGRDTYRARLVNGDLSGQLVRDNRETPFTGQRVHRQANLAGTWQVEVDTGDRHLQRLLKLEQSGQQITGTYSGGDLGERPLVVPKFENGRLTFAVEIQNAQADFTVDNDIQVHGDRLTGTVSVRGLDRKGTIGGVRKRTWNEPQELIQGNDLSNWDFQQVGAQNHWRVTEGVLINDAAGWNIFTKDKFQNYKLRIDVKIPPRGNSGIYLNGRYEVQVADSHGRGVSEGGMGAIYGRAVPTANPSKPADEWQTFEITFVDYWVTVTLNGTTIVDNVMIEGITGGALDSRESEPGPIMLQGDHGPIQYRRIVISTLAE